MDDATRNRYDQQWLLDFFSLGVWVHQYTGTALYHEMQRIPFDKTIATDDRPRIQAALRARILGETAASMETLGRFCWAIENRNPNGIATQYINMEHDRAKTFYAELLNCPNRDAENVLEQLRLPLLNDLAKLPFNNDVKEFFEQIANVLPRYASVYVDPLLPSNSSLLTQSYDAIIHGSAVIANAPTLVSPQIIPEDPHSIYIAVHWPLREEEMCNTTMQLVTRSLKQDAVMEDLDIIRTIAVIMTNLCQFLITLLDQGALTYE